VLTSAHCGGPSARQLIAKPAACTQLLARAERLLGEGDYYEAQQAFRSVATRQMSKDEALARQVLRVRAAY
jgi:hypothetical protein